MNLMHLRYLVEVEKTGSITKAASSLFMGQPNLSKAIKEVENELGAPIFKRISKGVEPTEKGVEFLECAKAIIQQLDKMENLFKPEVSDINAFKIAIPRASYIAHAFAGFVNELDRSKKLSINFRESNAIDSINGVVDGDYNMAVIRYDETYEDFFLSLLSDKELQYEEIWSFSYVAVMSSNNKLAGKDVIEMSDLEDYIEIVQGDVSVPYLSESYLKKTAAPEKNRIFVYDRGSQFDMLDEIPDTFMWVSPLPAEQIERHGLVQKKCSGITSKSKDILIMAKHYKPNDSDKAFISELKRVRDTLE